VTTLEADLYETDVVAWAEQQADALRRRAGGNALDWDNLADEIQDVSRTQTRAAESYIAVIIEHLLKLEFVRQPENTRGWTVSVRHARKSLNKELTPTLRARLPQETPDFVESQIERLTADGLIADDDVAPRRERPYTWEQVTGDWLPESQT
jgi:hypothetical protein